jgi:hypothetical protein
MRRRTVLGLLAGASTLGTGCILNPMPNHPVDLVVGNDTDSERTARVVAGGQMTPADADPPAGKTPTRIGIEDVSLDRTITLDSGRERRFEAVATLTDGPRYLGITVDVTDGPTLRRPIRVDPSGRETLLEAIINPADIDLGIDL